MEKLIVVVYTLTLLFLTCYSLVQTNLVRNYNRYQRRQAKNQPEEDEESSRLSKIPTDPLPFVTIQLPVYNEVYVIERLIRAVAQFDYPKDRMEIQVLDDSTDETTDIIAQELPAIRRQGISIEHVRRNDRTGFKAGALAEGLKTARGEFIAIFDADFVPTPDFLKNTIPYFDHADIGLVQGRWEHLNPDYSLLTRFQAFYLDAHFFVEQRGRSSAGHLINFNGTAGVWRKTCIIDAGGWQHDTLTEDLDLSYRAQLRGWHFRYLDEVRAPAELPVAMHALKTQQFRWMKGIAECARKNLWTVLQSPDLSVGNKIHASFHLLSSFLFICVLLLGVLSVPVLFIKNQDPKYERLLQIVSVCALASMASIAFYWAAFTRRHRGENNFLLHFISNYSLFMTVSMGLSLHNAIAVFEGLIGRKSPFIRTPKFNTQQTQDSWRKNKYLVNNLNPMTLLEGLLCIYFLSGIALAFYLRDFGFVPFHAMLCFGFGLVCYYSFIHARAIFHR